VQRNHVYHSQANDFPRYTISVVPSCHLIPDLFILRPVLERSCQQYKAWSIVCGCSPTVTSQLYSKSLRLDVIAERPTSDTVRYSNVSQMSDFAQQLAVQSWVLYGIGMIMILLRTSVSLSSETLQRSFLFIAMRDGIESEVSPPLQQTIGSWQRPYQFSTRG
jgi:hypothetical protein